MRALAVLLMLGMTAGVSAAPRAAAVFDFELIDSSMEGEVGGARADETERLGQITAKVREMFAAGEIYRPVDLAPIAGDLKAAGRLEKCNRCSERLARAVGADVAVYGYVQKVSNLILNLNIKVTDAATGALVKIGSVDIRGNNEASWLRGVTYLVNHDFKTP